MPKKSKKRKTVPKKSSATISPNPQTAPLVKPVPTPQPEQSEWDTYTWQKNLFNSVVGLLLLLAEGFGILTFKESSFANIPRWLSGLSLFLGLFSMTVVLVIFLRFIRRDKVTKRWLFTPKTNLQGILVLSFSYFAVAVLSIPRLYEQGYIASFTQWLQSWLPIQKISENASVAMAFVAGAIVSGVLGNFSYDLLKYAAKKLTGRNP